MAGLRGIAREHDRWRLGALTTWTDLLRVPLPPQFDGLKRAAAEVGGRQIQNAGTLAGNLCNASPAADGVPPLLSLSAEVELASLRGTRRVPLAEFILGSRSTACQPDELVSAILVPQHGTDTRATFLKLGARRYLVISIVMVAVLLEADAQGHITHAAVAVGACAPVARRLPELERRLLGQSRSSDLGGLARSSDLDVLAPISDVRGTAAYRIDAALTLVQRALREVADD